MEDLKKYDRLSLSSYGELKGKKRYYRVCCREVNWWGCDPDNNHIVLFTVVQFGNEKDYDRAKVNKEIKENYPCHILDVDLEKVNEAMNELRMSVEVLK